MRRNLAWLSSLCAAALLCAAGMVPQRATAADYDAIYYVNSPEAGKVGYCEPNQDVPEGSCTLYAALTRSNAEGASRSVLITTASGAPEQEIELPDLARDQLMTAEPVSTWDKGAVYVISAPVTIDLQNKLTLASGVEDSQAVATIYVDAPKVTLRNIYGIGANGSSIVAGPQVNDLMMDVLASGTRAESDGRFLTIRAGAQNITLQSTTLSRLTNSTDSPTTEHPGKAMVVIDGDESTEVYGVTIDGVLFGNIGTSGPMTRCPLGPTSVCSTTGLAASGRVRNLTIKNSTFQNTNRGFRVQDSMAVNLYGATATNVNITGNRFSNNDTSLYTIYTEHTSEYGVITLPHNRAMKGSNSISRNTFINTGLSNVGDQRTAIYGVGPYPAERNTQSSNLTIMDNYFYGFGTASVPVVRLDDSGIATVSRNLFDTSSGSQTPTVNEESASAGSLMYANGITTNQKVNTWYPIAVHRIGTSQSVELTLAEPQTAMPPGSALPAWPVNVDVYWTAGTTAETYLTTVTGLWGSTYTIANLQLPSAAIDVGTGRLRGGLRVQTQIPTTSTGFGQTQSSQYSRVIPLDDVFQPKITINQAEDYGDTPDQDAVGSYTRAVQFTMTSTQPLTAVTAGMFDLRGSTAPGARVSDVTCADALSCTVTVRANDTGLIVVSMPLGATTSVDGVINAASTTGNTPQTNNTVRFVNPLAVSPSTLTVTAGLQGSVVDTSESYRRDYTVTVADGAPAPAAPIEIAATVADQGLGIGVTVLSIPTGQRSGSSTVTARIVDTSLVPDGSQTTIAHAVRSDDPEFDGLAVGNVKVTITQLAARATVTKRAWIDVPADAQGSADAIMAHGVEVASGARLPDNTRVWWTYTIANTGQGTLSGLTVVDDVLGEVCTIETIAPAGQATCFSAGTVRAQ